METLKGIGWMVGGFAAMVAIFFVLSLLFTGVAYVSGIVMPWLDMASSWLLLFALLVLLPASFIRPTRVGAAIGFLLASFGFGLCAWVAGFLITYTHWGLIGVFIGLVIAGIGIVPVGFLAAMFHGDWHLVWVLFQYVALAIGCRIMMHVTAAKADRDQEERNLITIESR